jgi:hypothetical protein
MTIHQNAGLHPLQQELSEARLVSLHSLLSSAKFLQFLLVITITTTTAS